ncbi:CofH family radical SAM protein [Marine Group I thaumarchaeote]|uniref:Cyclic dehypoxanthine futalosine synthase n=1 Tax=Marine Group I thaumarchaeote TaxID=2511932 RepID=A0A7K4NGF5_9ARCH|nr:MAG: CofH family radical SAM protein [Nitrosopumilus sp. YT1]NMI81604.1 CofH family radical SAM protein [Candidatus Nitrosopumilus sp. MTA1]NWJ28440.1 CofH family radical SAM protein [Marine Group I thaumarchaeote]NWJ56892.1 CofH family radical SAM protein [Marine Group I thaumarchaeote]NWJ83895.1 CofH family radical SAM protein [Marine Group I thaumarchaeote]
MSQTTEQIQKSDIKDILDNSLNGKRPEPEDCLRLLESDDIHLMGLVSGHLVRKQFGKKISFINNIILNYTNVCITDCKFCAFYRSPGAEDSYTLTLDQIESRVKTSWDLFKIRQVLIQGGHNPNLTIEYYEDAFRMIRKKFPQVGVHGLSTSEIDMIAKVEKSSTKEILARLKDAGLQSIPGAGAEILVDSVKDVISPKKISSADWIRIMDEAHSLGLPASATMMYGHVENKNDIVEHFFKIVKLQEKTKGFMAFIPWNFEPINTLMHEEGLVEHGTGGVQLLKMIAISRLVFDGLIHHIQSSWLTNGVGMAQLALQYGADDFGGTLIGEEVVSCTGARSTELTDKKIINAIHQIGYQVEERDNFYNPVNVS